MVYDVVVSGHICLDFLPDMSSVSLARLPSPGQLFEIGRMQMATGGAVSNTGLALHKLGVPVGFMAKLGDDMIGGLILSLLNGFAPEITRTIHITQGQASSYSVVLSPENKDRIFLHCTGTNATFGAEDVDFTQVAQARIFHLGYPPILPRLIEGDGAQLAEIFRRAKASGVLTSLDMAMPDPNGPSGRANWPAILERTLPYVDVFLPSIEELLFMLRRSDFDRWQGSVLAHLTQTYLRALAGELLDMGAALAGFKLGAMGLYLRVTGDAARLENMGALALPADQWRDFSARHPAFEVQVAGTTGAGDSAYAGFLAALLKGCAPPEAMRWACAVGACNVEAVDAISGVQSWEATAARLAAGWPLHTAELPE